MKKMFFLGLSLLSLSAMAYQYNCDCVDTGLECDGMELMKITVFSTKTNVSLSDKDGDFPLSFQAVWDKNYIPRINKDYLRFMTSKVKNFPYPYLLVSKSMVKGSKNGTIKMPAIWDGDYGHTWYFECTKAQR